jgi:membrane-associated phospholipid phosphatase
MSDGVSFATRGIVRQAADPGRGVGVTEFLHGQADWPVVVLFGLVSQLGDVWFLFLLGGVLYVAGEFTPGWVIDRRQGLFVLALLITYLALVGVLKSYFVLPRPPGAVDPGYLGFAPPVLLGVLADVTTASGPGFPSGHALGTTMVWGGLALVLDRWRVRTRVGIAVGVVTLISLSRLVLGVHYLVDILAGAAVGLFALGALYWFSGRGADPGRVLGVAVVLALVGAVRTLTVDSVAALGAAIGGWLVWRGIAASVKPHPENGRAVATGVALLLIAGGLFGVVYVLDVSYSATFVAAAAAVGTVVGAPLVGERLA